MANKLLPLLTLPYLVQVLGIELYGVFAYSLALMSVFNIVVSFGFDLYATRLVSINRDNRALLQEYLNSVLYIRLALLVIGFVLLYIITSTLSVLKEYQGLHLINYLSVVGVSLFAVYYFQGIEQMKFATLLQVIAKVFFTVLVFVFVNEPDDIYLLTWIYALGFIVASVLSLFIIYQRHGFKFTVISLAVLRQHFLGSMPFFYARIATSIYSSATVLVLGAVLGNVAAGIFSIAEKLFRAIVSFYFIFNQLLYPYIAHKKDLVLYKRLFVVLAALNVVAAIILYAISPWLLPWLFGEQAEQSVLLMQLFALGLVIVLPAIMLGFPLLGALGFSDLVNRSVIYCAVLHLLLLAVLHPYLNLVGYVLLIIFSECVVFTLRCFYVLRAGVLRHKTMME